jgi:hypothetical protein
MRPTRYEFSRYRPDDGSSGDRITGVKRGFESRRSRLTIAAIPLVQTASERPVICAGPECQSEP